MSRLRQFRAKSVTVPNETIRRNDLSLQAKGFLALLLSYDDNWDFRFDHLVTLSDNGRESTRTAMKELEDKKYLKKTPSRDKDSRKFVGWDWIVSDKPMEDDESEQSEIEPSEIEPSDQNTEVPDTDIREADIRVSGRSGITEDNKNTNSKNTKKENPPTPQDQLSGLRNQNYETTLKINHPRAFGAYSEIARVKNYKFTVRQAQTKQILELISNFGEESFLKACTQTLLCIGDVASPLAYLRSQLEKNKSNTPPTPPKSDKPLWQQPKVSSAQFFYHPDYGKMFRLAASAVYGDHFAPDTTLDFMDADCTRRLCTLRADSEGLEVWSEGRHATN